MVHLRLNEKEPNPNPHVNFISPLPSGEPAAEEEARQLLRALAAQVKPVMKSHGFVVNSLEEYEYNKVFAGRNWNNGGVVEIVLRGAHGAYMPISWLMSTLCHELAHIKHMNHGPAFQALWTRLRKEVRDLQSKGYYGDGYWSSGTRLADSARVGGVIEEAELPEFMCGGAQTRQRPASLRRRNQRQRQQAGPSNRTGAQTAKKRKAGSRVTAQGTFKGDGKALNADISDEDGKKAGTGFRKKAGSKKAREERALAAERRIQALLKAGSTSSAEAEQPGSDSDTEGGEPPETDQDRRRTMLEMTSESDLAGLKSSLSDFSNEFMLPSPSTSRAGEPSRTLPMKRPAMDEGDHDEQAHSCDVQVVSKSGSTAATNFSARKAGRPSSSSPRDPTSPSKASESAPTNLDDWLGRSAPSSSSNSNSSPSRPKKKQRLSYGAMVQDEVQLRKKEALGMIGEGRTLGGAPSTSSSGIREKTHPCGDLDVREGDDAPGWTCAVCTLSNRPRHLACSACATPRGESAWAGPES